jgi:predicted lipoprotein with Yx(FWY)xxD motif
MSVTRILSLIAVAAIAVAACSSSYAGPASNGGGAPNAAAGAVIGSASSPDFGNVLTGPNGKTLYTHAGDSATKSTCDGACAATWPPLATKGQPRAGAGVTGQLGTVARADGTTQVTYGGMPLYYWEGDAKAGDVTGNGLEGFSVATVGGVGAQPDSSPAAPASQSPGRYGY